MKPLLPFTLVAAFAVGCAKGGDVESSADASRYDGSIVDQDADGVTEVDLTPDVTPDVDLPDVDLPDIDADEDGVVELDATPDVTPDIDLPDLDDDGDGVPEIDLDEDEDGVVELDLPDVTPDIDLPDLDADGDGRMEVDLDDDPDYVAANVAAPTLDLPDFDFDDMSASCPAVLNDVDLDIVDTSEGVVLTFTTNDEDDVTALRQYGARLAMEHTIDHDGLPELEGREVIISGRTSDGRDYVIRSGVPFTDARHRSHAVVGGVEDGIKVVIEPRRGNDVDMIQSMGESFAGQLQDR